MEPGTAAGLVTEGCWVVVPRRQRGALRGALGLGVHHQLVGSRAVFASSSATDEAAALSTCSTHLRSLDRIDLLRATPAVGNAVQTLINVRPVDSTLTACLDGHGSPDAEGSGAGGRRGGTGAQELGARRWPMGGVLYAAHSHPRAASR